MFGQVYFGNPYFGGAYFGLHIQVQIVVKSPSVSGGYGDPSDAYLSRKLKTTRIDYNRNKQAIIDKLVCEDEEIIAIIIIAIQAGTF